MIRQTNNGLVYYQFEALRTEKLIHGVFTRSGGISSSPFDSLNLGSTTGDSNENVAVNRKRIFDVFSLSVESIYDVWQVHGNDILSVSEPRSLDQEHFPADGIITNKKNITLFMRFADCVPVLFYDPIKSVIGIAHAGWQGTVKRIVQSTVKKMIEEYQVDPKNIIAGIGPSICAAHYQVGENVLENVNSSLPEIKDKIIYNQEGRYYFDLWKTNQLLLNQIGVDQVEISGQCTYSNTNEWYSHRKEGQKSGRFGVLITLV